MPFFEPALMTLEGGGEAEEAFSVVAGVGVVVAGAVKGVMSPVPLGWA